MSDVILNNIKKEGLSNTAKMLGIDVIELLQKYDLDYLIFDDINFKPYMNGVYGKVIFGNGYGVSVIKHEYSYGGPEGFYELAVINDEGDVIYDTPVTDNVIGWLNPKEITELMIQVQDLKNA
jgi:hypothetical protein